jgi:DNA-binding LytR/AlgR family response regulator
MIKVVICEDNIIFRDFLKKSLSKIFLEIENKFEIIEYSCGEDLLNDYPENIDIYFLDIEMKNINGMELARKIREENCSSEIIFTTALSDYIQDGYEVRAYRYLIKPIEFNELEKHVCSCLEDIYIKSENNLIIHNKGIVYKIQVDSITYIEVMDKDITIYTTDNCYEVKNSLSKLEKDLKKYNSKFYRCHKSYLVNMKHIQYIKKNTVFVKNTEIPVSRHKIKDFKLNLADVLGDVIC